MFGRDLFFRLAHRTGVIELFHQFRTIEHSILKFIVEIEGTVRAVDHAKHAIHALAMIVNGGDRGFFSLRPFSSSTIFVSMMIVSLGHTF